METLNDVTLLLFETITSSKGYSLVTKICATMVLHHSLCTALRRDDRR